MDPSNIHHLSLNKGAPACTVTLLANDPLDTRKTDQEGPCRHEPATTCQEEPLIIVLLLLLSLVVCTIFYATANAAPLTNFFRMDRHSRAENTTKTSLQTLGNTSQCGRPRMHLHLSGVPLRCETCIRHSESVLMFTTSPYPSPFSLRYSRKLMLYLVSSVFAHLCHRPTTKFQPCDAPSISYLQMSPRRVQACVQRSRLHCAWHASPLPLAQPYNFTKVLQLKLLWIYL